MRRALRWLGLGTLSLFLLLLAVAGGGYVWLRQGLPLVDGEVILKGPSAPIDIIRDRHAVPHIRAQTIEDALFAQGFAHAQDRLWQMEFQRRIGQGRLADIVGADALSTDRFMRLLGFYRLAEANLEHLSADAMNWLKAYAAGVNAYLANRRGPLPPEFLILGHHDIEPWRPADSVVWLKLMALDLAKNWHNELLRARLSHRLSDQQIADLWPDHSTKAPISLSALHDSLDFERLLAILPKASAPGIGSNGWVVSGERSETGAAIMANDPHLGLGMPGVWHLSHLKSPELELIGAGLPGVPGIVLGHNGSVAWGMTNTGSDVQDLFIEKIDPDDPERYLTPDGSAPFEQREEIIDVKDGESVAFTIRTTRHGPVLSDLLGDTGGFANDEHVLALSWTALIENDTSIETLFDLSKARDWDTFLAAIDTHGSPQQNLFFADKAGDIGMVAPGMVPIRRSGDGLWPVPGWTGDHDWIGMIPANELPMQRNPESQTIVNANNRIVGDDYPHLIAALWEAPHRARRIEDLLGDETHDLDSFAEIQLDQFSLLADDFLPLMMMSEPAHAEAAGMIERLKRWDRVMRADEAEPLIFAAWYRAFTRSIYQDELGPLFSSYWGIRPQFINDVLTEKPIWCDDIETDPVEDCLVLASIALDEALRDLKERFGDNPDDWRWGKAHPARMDHPILGAVPVIGSLFNNQHPVGGDSVTVNVGHYRQGNEADPFASIQGASYRGLYDLENLDQSRFIAATGQSGHPLSTHYRDLTTLWANGEFLSMDRAPNSYEREALGRLTLRPE